MTLTEKDLKEINEEISKMTPSELREFRNCLDADSMGNEGGVEGEDNS